MQKGNYTLYLKPERVLKLKAICIERKLCENGPEGQPNFSKAIKELIDQAQVSEQIMARVKGAAGQQEQLLEFELT